MQFYISEWLQLVIDIAHSRFQLKLASTPGWNPHCLSHNLLKQSWDQEEKRKVLVAAAFISFDLHLPNCCFGHYTWVSRYINKGGFYNLTFWETPVCTCFFTAVRAVLIKSATLQETCILKSFSYLTMYSSFKMHLWISGGYQCSMEKPTCSWTHFFSTQTFGKINLHWVTPFRRFSL